jgi:hypothetical protein
VSYPALTEQEWYRRRGYRAGSKRMTLTRIWQYVTSVIGYWQFWVAVAFLIERSLER